MSHGYPSMHWAQAPAGIKGSGVLKVFRFYALIFQVCVNLHIYFLKTKISPSIRTDINKGCLWFLLMHQALSVPVDNPAKERGESDIEGNLPGCLQSAVCVCWGVFLKSWIWISVKSQLVAGWMVNMTQRTPTGAVIDTGFAWVAFDHRGSVCAAGETWRRSFSFRVVVKIHFPTTTITSKKYASTSLKCHPRIWLHQAPLISPMASAIIYNMIFNLGWSSCFRGNNS